ncbi:hypothetical protein IL306_008931 [Fusarium sp. DS 682]|nr:hypothetical protein IL306_008931 [Fusarium sp. DS 682]
MQGVKICWESYKEDGGVVRYYVEDGMPCLDLKEKLDALTSIGKASPDFIKEVYSDKFWLLLALTLFNYFLIRKQLRPKSNDEAKNRVSNDLSSKFQIHDWIQRNEKNRFYAVVFSCWVGLLQVSQWFSASTIVPYLAGRVFLDNSEWTEPYFFGSISTAVRVLMFSAIVLGFLGFWAYLMKMQELYIRALIRLEISPKKTEDRSSVPQEPSVPVPPVFAQKTTSKEPTRAVSKQSVLKRPVPKEPVPTATFSHNFQENGWGIVPQKHQLETSSQKPLPDRIPPWRISTTPVCPPRAPRFHYTPPMIISRQPTTTTHQQGYQANPLQFSYDSSGDFRPQPCTGFTANRADAATVNPVFPRLGENPMTPDTTHQDPQSINTAFSSYPSGWDSDWQNVEEVDMSFESPESCLLSL